MSAHAKLVEKVRKHIKTDLSGHNISTPYGSSGVFRMWRCKAPETAFDFFDVVTWPGSLAFTGDRGVYVFRREHDMIPWVRESWPSFSYMAEKLVAVDKCGPVRVFNIDKYREAILDQLTQEQESFKPHTHTIKTLQGLLEDEPNSKHEAQENMMATGIFDGCDLPSVTSYNYHFLWCCHALGWFCDKIQEGGEG